MHMNTALDLLSQATHSMQNEDSDQYRRIRDTLCRSVGIVIQANFEPRREKVCLT